MNKDLKAMLAMQHLVGKMQQGLKPAAGSPLIAEAVDLAEAVMDEIEKRDAPPPAPAAPAGS